MKRPSESQGEGNGSRSPIAKRKAAEQAAADRRAYREAQKALKLHDRNESRRFTAHLRRRRIVLFAILGSVVGLAVFVGVGVFSPLMALRHISVTGTHRVSATQIEQSLEGQIGRPLPLVDTSLVVSVLAKQPLVKSYSLVSEPPDTLVVAVVERSPIGYLKTARGYALVDPAGVTLDVSDTMSSKYPLINVSGGSPTSHGFAPAISVLNALPASVAADVRTIEATSTDNVVLILKRTGVRVVWGSAEQSALKAVVLAQLMSHYHPSSHSVYDVSSPTSAVVR